MSSAIMLSSSTTSTLYLELSGIFHPRTESYFKGRPAAALIGNLPTNGHLRVTGQKLRLLKVMFPSVKYEVRMTALCHQWRWEIGEIATTPITGLRVASTSAKMAPAE